MNIFCQNLLGHLGGGGGGEEEVQLDSMLFRSEIIYYY